jgi:hypothetical protein
MATKVASLYAELSADTSKFDQSLSNSRQSLDKAQFSLNKFATTASGDLRGSVDAFSNTLKNATPQNLAFAATFKGIEEDFNSGKISINDARVAIANLKDGMGPAEIKAKSLSSSMMEMKGAFVAATIAAAGIAFAAKQIYNFGKSGAELEYTASKFDRLSASIGATSYVLQDDLRKATRGMVSDSELMASATNFMTLGLVRTQEEAVRLTTIAGALKMDMNQLVLTLTNQTTMRFDALGVAVRGFDERVAALKKTGMSANDAFNEAFLQQAEAQMKKVGVAADSSTSSFVKLENSVKNVTDIFKRGLSPALGEAANSLYEIVDGYAGALNAEVALTNAAAAGVITWNEANDAINRMTWTNYTASDAMEWLGKRLRENNPLYGESITHFGDLSIALAGVTSSTSDYSTAVDVAAEKAEHQKLVQDLFNETITRQKDEAYAAQTSILGLAESYKSMSNAQMAQEMFAGLREEMEKDGVVTETEKQRLYDYGLALGALSESGILFAESKQAMVEAMYAGVISDEGARAATDAYNLSLKQGNLDLDALLLKHGEVPEDAAASALAFASVKENGLDIMSFSMNQATEETMPALQKEFDTTSSKAGMAASKIAAVEAKLARLDGMSATVFINVVETTSSSNAQTVHGYGSNAITNYGGGEFAGAEALGGPVVAGSSYLVGEQGIEKFTPAQNGVITPNSAMDNTEVVKAINALRRELPRALRDAVLLAGVS